MAQRPNVELDVGGADFLLRGKFSEWESNLAFGPDLDQLNVRLAIDATSTARNGRNLFAFHSRQVEPAGNGAYLAKGVFTGPLGSTASEMLIENPPGHSPIVVVAFAANKSDFGDGWHDLIQGGRLTRDPEDEGGPSPLAHAWMLPPDLAAA